MQKVLFVVFMIIYFYFVNKYFYNYGGIAGSLAFFIGGLWGLFSNRMLFMTGFTKEKQAKVVNWIFVVGGLFFAIYFIIQRL